MTKDGAKVAPRRTRDDPKMDLKDVQKISKSDPTRVLARGSKFGDLNVENVLNVLNEAQNHETCLSVEREAH